MAVSLGGSGGVRSDINVTPLVDVCLVLLIIFMVVTPMLQQGVAVALPEGATVVERPGTREDLVISIREDGTIYQATSWIPDGDLSQWLTEEARRDAQRPIVLKADANVSHGIVKGVLRQASEAGFRRVAVLTEQSGGDL